MGPSSPDLGGATASGGPAAAARPDAIKAIPVRHWGRWISAAVVTYLLVALVYSFVASPNIDWPTVWEYLFKPLTLIGLSRTIELTFVCMAVGAAGGVMLAVMRLSDNPVLSWIAWGYIWFFRGTPVYVQIILWANIGVLWTKFYAGLPFTGLVFGSTASGPLVGNLFVVAVLALGLNEAAYAAELVRAGIDGDDAGPHQLCRIGCLVEAQGQDRDHEQVVDEEAAAAMRDDEAREREPDVERAVQHADVAPEDDLHVHGSAAEEPDVHPGDPREHRVVGETHDGQDRPAGSADRHRDEGQFDGKRQSPQSQRLEHVVEDRRPVDVGALDEREHQRHHEIDDDGRTEPAAPVPDRDGLDDLRAGGGGRSPGRPSAQIHAGRSQAAQSLTV